MRDLLARFRENGMTVDSAVQQLRDLPYQDIGFAKLDHHRALRTGWPEVVFGKGKTPEQVAQIVSAMKGRGHPVLVTKTDQETYQAVLQETPEAEFHQLAKAIVVPTPQKAPLKDGIIIVTAGTADLPVAEEAVLTATLMGNDVRLVTDVGGGGSPPVAGPVAGSPKCAGDCGRRGDGRRTGGRGRRFGVGPGDSGTHQHWLRCQLRRPGPIAQHAK